MLEVCGEWDERVPYAADTDLWLRMMFRTQVRKVDEFWSQRRLHDAQRDTQAAKISRDFCRMIDQSQDIKNASAEIQRMAAAAKHLIQVRYNGTGSDWTAAWHAWQAGRLAPEIRNPRGVLHLLGLPARRVASRLKAAMVGH